jgi:hypothetical protein
MAARAGVAALEGRGDEARAGFQASWQGFRELGMDFLLARTILDAIVVLPPGSSQLRAEVAEARSIFQRVGAQAYLDLLDSALSRGSLDAERVTGASTATAASTDRVEITG